MDSLTEAQKKIIYDVINKMSSETGEEEIWLKSQVEEDLESMNNKNTEIINIYINDVIMNNKLGWDHSVFTIMKQKEHEQDNYIQNPYEVEEGVIQCTNQKCGSFKVFSRSAQTRSADEPTTTFAECTQCKNKWSQNG